MTWIKFLSDRLIEIVSIVSLNVVAIITILKWDEKRIGKIVGTIVLLLSVIISIVALKKSANDTESENKQHITEREQDSLKYAEQKNTVESNFKLTDSNYKLQIQSLKLQLFYGKSIDYIQAKTSSIVGNLSSLEGKFVRKTDSLYNQELRQDYLLNNDINLSIQIDIANKGLLREVDSITILYPVGRLFRCPPQLEAYLARLNIYFELQSLHLYSASPFYARLRDRYTYRHYPEDANVFIVEYEPQTRIIRIHCDVIKLFIDESISHKTSILDYQDVPVKLLLRDGAQIKPMDIYGNNNLDNCTVLNSDSVNVIFQLNFSKKMASKMLKGQVKKPNFFNPFNFEKLGLVDLLAPHTP
jgi:hypothetical protein